MNDLKQENYNYVKCSICGRLALNVLTSEVKCDCGNVMIVCSLHKKVICNKCKKAYYRGDVI